MYLNILTAMAFSVAILAPGQSAMAQSVGCPPGLAKKNQPCVPPGQAKKGVTTEEWLNRYRIGERVDPENVRWIDDYSRLEGGGFRPKSGY